MKDPWEKAYVYGRNYGGRVAHIVVAGQYRTEFLCDPWDAPALVSRTPKPYPVCKHCLRTKRAKELRL